MCVCVCVVVTAHWIADTVSVASGQAPQLLFDYGGFPSESYEYNYPANGSPELSKRIQTLLEEKGITAALDSTRKWDHGVFVPLMLMFPEADIPVVSLSLHSNLNPELHIDIGRALAPLRDEGVLIIGSGMSFHNFEYFFARDAKTKADGVRHSEVWNEYLVSTLVSGGFSRNDQIDRLVSWSAAPSATASHPLGQEEHLIPLHVMLGAAGEDSTCRNFGGESSNTDFFYTNFEWT